MAQLIVAAAGAAIGGATLGTAALTTTGIFAGVTGTQIGWLAGSLLFAAFTPGQKTQGPLLSDLSVTGTAYGTIIPFIQGHPRVGGFLAWASAKRPIAHTQRSGKGGGSKHTSYTYEVDLLYELCDNEIDGVANIWEDGKLLWTSLASAGQASLDASAEVQLWRRMTIYTGGAAQQPDPLYEAAVGIDRALAFRGRGCVMIEGLQLDGSGRLRNLTFEPVVSATTQDALTVLQTDFSDGTAEDQSAHRIGSGVSVGPGVVTALGYVVAASPGAPTTSLTWTAAELRKESGVPMTYECLVEMTIPGAPPYPYAATNGINLFTGVLNLLTTTNFLFGVKGFTFYGPMPDMFFQGFGAVSDVLPSATSEGYNYQSPTTRHHLALVLSPDPLGPGSYTARAYIDGYYVLALAANYGGDDTAPTASVTLGGSMDTLQGLEVALTYKAIRVRKTEEYTGTSAGQNFTPPLEFPDPDPPSLVIVEQTLQQVVTNICLRAGLSSGQFDATALASITKPVRALAASQVGPASVVLDLLASAYFFEWYLTDKLYFVPMGGGVARTIEFEETGVHVDGADPGGELVLKLDSELELPGVVAVTYKDANNAQQTDTQSSDRVLSTQKSVKAIELPLAFTPTEAKAIANAMMGVMRTAVASGSFTVSLSHSAVTPTSVLLVGTRSGAYERVRVMRRVESDGVLQFDVVADDASVLTQSGVTSGATPAATTVARPGTTELLLMDAPLLRDADNRAGLYAAFAGIGDWQSAALYVSADDITYTPAAQVNTETAVGRCLTVLGDWDGRNVFDEKNTVRVRVDGVELESYARAEILSGTAPAYWIGGEILYAQYATLVSAGVYTLSGLLRARRGTDHFATGHAASEWVARLAPEGYGLRFVPFEVSELGARRYFKAPSAAQRLAAAATKGADLGGESLRPFSVVDVRANRNTSDTVVTWSRRTRLATRLVGPLPISAPLGEASEAYEIDVYASGAYSTLKRTLTATGESVTYTAAQQTTDFGSAQSVLYLDIYQMSEAVGRGHRRRVAV